MKSPNFGDVYLTWLEERSTAAVIAAAFAFNKALPRVTSNATAPCSNDAPPPNADLYRIGVALHLSRSNEGISEDTELNHLRLNRMRATVSRYIGKANMLIGNLECGEFPVYKKTLPIERFSSKQKEAHVELEKLWWDLDLSSSLYGSKVNDAINLIKSNKIAYNWFG